MRKRGARRRSAGLLLSIVVSTVVVSTVGVIIRFGYPYYLAPAATRIFGPEHRIFGSAGLIGLSCGIAAAGLFLSNLTYLVRKSTRLLARAGSLRSWLRWHVVSGLLGALLVPLHAAFEVRSTVGATCVWSLGIVVVTGLIGRYMVGLVPRTVSGEQMGTDLVEDELMLMIDHIRPAVIHQPGAIPILQRIADSAQGGRDGAMTVRDQARRLREARRNVHKLSRLARTAMLSNSQVDVRGWIRRAGRLYRQAVAADLAGRVLESWRIFHGVLAVLFVAALGLHVGAAIYFGFVHL